MFPGYFAMLDVSGHEYPSQSGNIQSNDPTTLTSPLIARLGGWQFEPDS